MRRDEMSMLLQQAWLEASTSMVDEIDSHKSDEIILN